jgi:Histidine kinase-, DNA gyrase B-, and HSP90-like ATPase
MPDKELDSIISKYINKPKGPRPDQIDLSRYYRKPEETKDDEKFGFDDVVAFAARGLASLSPPLLPGAAIGGGMEALVEKYIEKRPVNPKRVALEAAINAVPFGTTVKLGRSIFKGMGLGVGGALGAQQVESPKGLHTPTQEEIKGLALPAVFGGAGGAIGYGIGKWFGRGRTVPEPEPEPNPFVRRTGTGSRYTPEPEGPLPPPPNIPPTSAQRVTTGGFTLKAPPRSIVPDTITTGTGAKIDPNIVNQPPVKLDFGTTKTGTAGEIKADVPASPVVKPPVVEPPVEAKIGDELVPEQGPIEKRIFLPKDLQGANPYFNMGNKEWRPVFNNDVDKALMIVAQKKPNKRDRDYLNWLNKYTGLDDNQLRTAGERVKTKLKTLLKDAPTGTFKAPKLHDIELTKPARPTITTAMGEGIGNVTIGPKIATEVATDTPTVKASEGEVPVVKAPREPEFSITSKGNLKTGINEDAAIRVITNLYQGNIGTIAAKELVQNSLDNLRPQGEKGEITIDLDNIEKTITVRDNGTGMTPEQVSTVYTNIGETGKRAKLDIGGYGIAKAGFQLGGERFTLATIAKNKKGKIVKTEYSATPEELRKGLVKPTITEMPAGTPTGTTVTVKVPEDEDVYNADEFVNTFSKYSGVGSKVNKRTRWTKHLEMDRIKYEQPDTTRVESINITTLEGKHFDLKISAPGDAALGTRDQIQAIILNKGMYQGSMNFYISETKNIPDKIVVDVNSKVDALDTNYPFVPSREALKNNASEKIRNWITEELVNPARTKRKALLIDKYDSLKPASFNNVLNKDSFMGPKEFVFYDPNGKITEVEVKIMENNTILNNISYVYTDIINSVVASMKKEYPHWKNEIEKVGFIFENPGYYGVHIPHPEKSKSAILLNPFAHFVEPDGMTLVNPTAAVTDLVHTTIHEIAHSPLTPGGGLVQHEQAKFEQLIGQIYKKMAFDRRFHEDQILKGISDDDGITYNSGLQRLLQFYSEATGRKGTEKDILSGTGTQRGYTGTKSNKIPPNRGGNGRGDSWYSGGKKWFKETTIPEEVADVANVAKSFSSAGDLSAPMRQGIFLMGRDSWRRAWLPMLKALKTSNHEELMAKRLADPMYAEAKQNGLMFTSHGKLDAVEESYASNLAKKIPIFGQGLIAPSERAFTTFLDELRLGTYKDLVDKGRKLGVPIDEKNIAQYINTASGRGTIGFRIGDKSDAGEKAAILLNTMFFSPRFIASRIQLLNPFTYSKLDPFTRKEALRDLATMAGVASTTLTMAKMAGAEVETDPREVDFGKAKIGNTRVDLLGGFGPYIRFFSETVNGMFSDEPGPDVSRFVESKLSPAARAVRDSIQQKDYLRKDTTVPKAVANAFAPLIAQDTYALWKEDPSLIPLAGAAAVGIPVQTYGETRPRRRNSQFPRVRLPKMPSVSLPR